MKVTISRKEDSSISEDIGDVELSNLTIFAGENNAGKTTLVNSIGEELEKQGVNVIHIPAERVILDAELKTGADKDPFKNALSDLLDIKFDSTFVSSFVDDIEVKLPGEFSKYQIENMGLVVKTKKPKDDEYKKAIKDIYIKKLIESISITDGYCNKSGIGSSEIGQGTERLIIASLLKYIGEKRGQKSSNAITYIIFEEPEIYLHPKLKQTLYSTLSELALNESSGIKIILTTHDPYFIELGREFKIYKVDRLGKDNSTRLLEVKNNKRYLGYDSSAEINYIVFDLPSQTYLLELYQYLKGQKKYEIFDLELSDMLKIPQDRYHDNGVDKMTFITRLRHDLAHPKSKQSVENFTLLGREAISKLHEYCDSLTK